MNKEKELIRNIITAELTEIEPLADKAVKEFGIKFPDEFIDDLLYVRMEEYEKRPFDDILVEYGFLLNSCKRCKWALGESTIRESIKIFIDARNKMHTISRETGRKLLESLGL
jgi:hypothetical protein